MSKNQGTSEDFHSIIPPLVRLLVGVIALLVIQNVVLNFPGMTQSLPGIATLTAAGLAVLAVGLVMALVVLKFGTQLSSAVADAYRSAKAWAPLLTYFFQIAALWILYMVCQGIATSIFVSAPWAYPLVFLALAIIPTIRVVANIVQSFEGPNVQKHTVSRDQF